MRPKLIAQELALRSGAMWLTERALVRRGGGEGVRVFYGHHVHSDGQDGTLTVGRFREIVAYLQRRYELLTLTEAVERLQDGGPLRRSVAVITFDDGYRDNLTNALPVLRELEAPATIFVATGPLMTGKRLWYDEVTEWISGRPEPELAVSWRDAPIRLEGHTKVAREVVEELKRCEAGERRGRVEELRSLVGAPADAAFADNATLSREDLLELAATPGIEIGGHTATHPILPRTDDAEAWAEITQNAAHLEALLGRRPTTFAYPNGDFADVHVRMLQEAGYRAAVTTAPGMNRLGGADVYRLRRMPLGSGRLCQFVWQSCVRGTA